ncbi:hypothetical protein [Aquicella lusitana]|uniref:Uncharacterized protein n=1 Tax=Aquicella lusitana TaxID=254246 RepID=A0A370GRH6_9COXI|nr:hypothetical protein [Aquicella lusitana]RDI44553.1 hypothetical protein C8D86_10935 [Aquicella lusitana]VVC72505.1 hypothetical protein AQULUS_02170 [Aquicella lusitana]
MRDFASRIFTIMLSVALILAHENVLAAPSKRTISCARKNIQFKHNEVVLNTRGSASPKVYFIKNISKYGIWLNRYQSDRSKSAGASAGWSSFLKPGNWSALLLSEKNFTMGCSIVGPGKITYLKCKKVIQVCESSLHAEPDAGSYWAVENKKWDDFLKEVLKKFKKRSAT